MLCSLTAFYDDVNASMDRPPDHIVNNDHLLDDWLQRRKREHDIETAKRFAKQSPGSPQALGDVSEGSFTARDVAAAENPMHLIQKGGTISLPNQNVVPVMVFEEPTFEDMQRIHPTQ